MDDLFFDGSVEAFNHTVGFRFADEGEARREAVKAALALKPVGEILTAVIVMQFDCTGGVSGIGAEDTGDCLGNRFVGGKTVAVFSDVVAETLGVPLLNGGKQP